MHTIRTHGQHGTDNSAPAKAAPRSDQDSRAPHLVDGIRDDLLHSLHCLKFDLRSRCYQHALCTIGFCSPSRDSQVAKPTLECY
jgi:hypothetical protein